MAYIPGNGSMITWGSGSPMATANNTTPSLWGRGLQRDVVYLSTNIALVYEPKCGGGELRGLSKSVQLYTGAEINFGDLTPYLTYVVRPHKPKECNPWDEVETTAKESRQRKKAKQFLLVEDITVYKVALKNTLKVPVEDTLADAV